MQRKCVCPEVIGDPRHSQPVFPKMQTRKALGHALETYLDTFMEDLVDKYQQIARKLIHFLQLDA